MAPYDCPGCGTELEPVLQPADSPLNEDQWRSIIAGDYVCRTCPGDRAKKNNHRYFWESELEELAKKN